MCGIIGYVGKKPSSEVLLEGLKRLEYRGYDSAGICVDSPEGFKIIKSTGKLKNLLAIVPPRPFGHNGIGHTRWATHGGVTEANAHPHTDCSGKIAVVHNGIIENYEKLRELLKDKVLYRRLRQMIYIRNLPRPVNHNEYLIPLF